MPCLRLVPVKELPAVVRAVTTEVPVSPSRLYGAPSSPEGPLGLHLLMVNRLPGTVGTALLGLKITSRVQTNLRRTADPM